MSGAKQLERRKILPADEREPFGGGEEGLGDAAPQQRLRRAFGDRQERDRAFGPRVRILRPPLQTSTICSAERLRAIRAASKSSCASISSIPESSAALRK